MESLSGLRSLTDANVRYRSSGIAETSSGQNEAFAGDTHRVVEMDVSGQAYGQRQTIICDRSTILQPAEAALQEILSIPIV